VKTHASTRVAAGVVQTFPRQESTLNICEIEEAQSLTSNGHVYVKGAAIHLNANQGLNGDAAIINWNYGAAREAPARPEKNENLEQAPAA
jgi:hypothetical protein